jgi:WD40 repeat protein
MDHPNIARVFDARQTESGRPYFVMELVKGAPITEFCDQNQHAPRQRLELFIPVCHAVQHAHQKGIIHRDLKPSNILVAVHDKKPAPKVIDFGIAKAVGGDLTDKMMSTGLGHMVGTPLYMSPEQASKSNPDVDTRSDIYSLGVLLYELLTGTTPFDKERLKEASYEEICRLIREEEPPKPSARMHALGSASASVSADRESEAHKLSQLFRGDLDWIVMKCLEKDRHRRYETAYSLARDIERYLHDDPVEACPPSVGYRLRKFARRNRMVLATAAAVVVTLLVGIAISVWQAVRAKDAEDWAEKGWTAEKIERERAVTAERQAKERLFEAKVSQAEASQWSGRAGQRFASLEALADAARLIPDLALGKATVLDLRNRAVISLTRADLRLCPPAQQPDGPGDPFEGAWHVQTVGSGKITLQARADPAQLFHIPGSKPQMSRCGRYCAVSITSRREVQVWAMERKAAVCTIPESASVVFSPDSQFLVAGMADGSLRVIHLPGGNEVTKVASAATRATKIAIAPGRRAALVRNSELSVVDLGAGKTIASHETGATIKHVQWHPQGNLLAFSVRITKRIGVGSPPPISSHEKVGLWTPGSNVEPVFLTNQFKTVSALAFHPDGLTLASAGDGTLHLWDPQTGKSLVGMAMAASDVMFGPEENMLAYRHAKKVGFLQAATGQECRTIAAQAMGRLAALDISPNERWLASASVNGVRVWDLSAGKEVAFLKSKSQVPAVAFDPVNGNLVTCAALEARFKDLGYEHMRHDLVRDAAGNVKLAPLSAESPPEDWRPRNQFLFVDPVTQKHFRGAISKDGRWLVKGSSSGPVGIVVKSINGLRLAAPRLVDRTSGAEHGLPGDGETGFGHHVALSPDGRRLVVASSTKYYFWQTDPLRRTGVIVREPGSSGGGPAAFAADGQMAAVARSPSQITIVDSETLDELVTLSAPNPENLVSLCFGPEGRWLAAGTQSGQIQAWDLGSIRRQLAAIGLDWNK